MGREVHRLQWGVGLHGNDVLGFQHFGGTFECGRHIALGLGNFQHLACFQSLACAIHHAGIAQGGACAFVPLNGQQIAGLLGLPPAGGHHGNAVGDLHHVNHTSHGFGFAAIEALDRAANHRALRQRGVDHAWQLDVNAKLGCAVDLGGRVHTLGALAHDFEIFGVFHRWFLRHRHARCSLRQFTVGGLQALGAVNHALVGTNQIAVHRPTCSGSRDEHFAHLSAGHAQLEPAVAHGGGAARDLRAQQSVDKHRIRRCSGHFNLADVYMELFSNQHGHGGVHALAHFRAGRQQSDDVVVGNVHPGVGRVHGACSHGFALGAWQVETEHQTTCDGSRCFEE